MKILKRVLFIFLILFAYETVKAQSGVKSITMDIYIDASGDAHVTETWNATIENGTEGFKPYYNLGNSKFTDFTVSMDGTIYQDIGSWNPTASFGEKSYKNGIHYINNGIELCFGISEYGTHTYTMKYTIKHFVAGLEDADMVYWTLIPYDFSLSPQNVYIKIYADEKFSNDIPVWGYGNYGGYAYVYDGYIELESNGPLSSSEYMTVLIQFPKGTFNTENNTIDNNFQYYLDMAEEGATHYTETNNKVSELLILIIFLIFAGVFFLIGYVLYSSWHEVMTSIKVGGRYFKYNEYEKNLPKDVPLYRDIPCNKDIYRAYWVATAYNLTKKETDFLGAILLKWLKEGKIKITKIKSKILKREETAIEFIPNFASDLDFEVKLYNMMYEARVDGILESKEFEKWCSKNYTKILNWFSSVLNYETNALIGEKKIVDMPNKKNKQLITTSLFEEGKKLKGLKKFLNEFSKIDSREAIEVAIWEEYLMYAQILGIADKVAKQFKKLYPGVITDYSYDSVIFIHTVSYHGMNSAVRAKSAAEARARSYSSGGGGFSSGGGGGGSFGGGGGGGGFR